MTEKLKIFKNPYLLLFFGLGIFILFFIFASLSTQPEDNEEAGITPSQGVSSPENSELYIQKSPTVESLTEEEQKYPEAAPQVFPGADTSRTGTLIVLSDPPNTNIVLEQNSGEEVSEYNLPFNTAPFKASGVPVGKYTITSAKEGYDYTAVTFKIEENKITRVLIKLPPIR